MLTIILAIASDGAIGDRGDLLWHLRDDLRRFKALTTGHPVIMGRRTWESLPKGALPGRRNIVVTRQTDFPAPGAETARSLPEALEMCAGADAFVIGGAMLYAEALPLADALELTRVRAEYPEADTRMPEPADPELWRLAEASEPATDERSGLTYVFETYRRK